MAIFHFAGAERENDAKQVEILIHKKFNLYLPQTRFHKDDEGCGLRVEFGALAGNSLMMDIKDAVDKLNIGNITSSFSVS